MSTKKELMNRQIELLEDIDRCVNLLVENMPVRAKKVDESMYLEKVKNDYEDISLDPYIQRAMTDKRKGV